MCIVGMSGNTVTLVNPAEPSKAKARQFTFDHAYWSHDGFKQREDGYCEAASKKYADQVNARRRFGCRQTIPS